MLARVFGGKKRGLRLRTVSGVTPREGARSHVKGLLWVFLKLQAFCHAMGNVHYRTPESARGLGPTEAETQLRPPGALRAARTIGGKYPETVKPHRQRLGGDGKQLLSGNGALFWGAEKTAVPVVQPWDYRKRAGC